MVLSTPSPCPTRPSFDTSLATPSRYLWRETLRRALTSQPAPPPHPSSDLLLLVWSLTPACSRSLLVPPTCLAELLVLLVPACLFVLRLRSLPQLRWPASRRPPPVALPSIASAAAGAGSFDASSSGPPGPPPAGSGSCPSAPASSAAAGAAPSGAPVPGAAFLPWCLLVPPSLSLLLVQAASPALACERSPALAASSAGLVSSHGASSPAAVAGFPHRRRSCSLPLSLCRCSAVVLQRSPPGPAVLLPGPAVLPAGASPAGGVAPAFVCDWSCLVCGFFFSSGGACGRLLLLR